MTPRAPLQQQWREACERRIVVAAKPSWQEREEYKKRERDDRKRRDAKFHGVFDESGDTEWQPPLARALRRPPPRARRHRQRSGLSSARFIEWTPSR